MSFVSFAQNYEDVMLFRALHGIERGFYIDIGAEDPVADSVTKAFYELGWRGINVEPVTFSFQRLVADRPHDINLQIAVSDVPGKLHLYEVVGSGLSTTDPAFAKQHAQAGHEIHESDVECLTLDEICKEYSVDTVHFLKVDCEGCEAAALRGLSLERIRPWIILAEATEPNSQKAAYMDWEPSLVERGYHFVYADGLNRFYVADEHNELDLAFSCPPNFFDGFVRAAEAKVRSDLHVAKEELSSLRDPQRIARAESENDVLRADVGYLQLENERREAALIERQSLLDEAAEREAQAVVRARVEGEQWRTTAEYLRGENERREAALIERQRLLDEAAEREVKSLARARVAEEQWREQAEDLRVSGERKELALVERQQVVVTLGEALKTTRLGVAAALELEASLRRELANYEGELKVLRAELADRLVEIPRLQSEIGRLHGAVASRDQEMAHLRGVVGTLQRSISWRITYPLRLAKRGVRAVIGAVYLVAYQLLRWPARLARPLLRFLARRAWLRSVVLRIIGRDSRLAALTHLFLSSGVTPVVHSSEQREMIQPSQPLTRQAMRVFEEIQVVRSERLQGNGSSQSRTR